VLAVELLQALLLDLLGVKIDGRGDAEADEADEKGFHLGRNERVTKAKRWPREIVMSIRVLNFR